MEECLSIKSLGPLKDVRIDKIYPVMVLVGESGSGKSLLLKVLAMMRHISKRQLIIQALKQNGVRRLPLRMRFDSYLHFSAIDALVTSETRLDYELKTDWCIVAIEVRARRLKVRYSHVGEDKQVVGPFLKVAFVGDARNSLAAWARKGARLQSKVFDNYFAATYALWDETIDTTPRADIDFFGVHLTIDVSQKAQRLVYLRTPDGRETTLDQGASGEKAAIPLALIVRYLIHGYDYEEALRRAYTLVAVEALVREAPLPKEFGKVEVQEIPFHSFTRFKDFGLFLHIEEPELSLDPKTQIRFADDLMETLDASLMGYSLETSVVFTTHSPYWVTALNTLVEEAKHPFLTWSRIGGCWVKADGTVQTLRDEEVGLLLTPNMDEATEQLDVRYREALEGNKRG